jgi:hypothetical protein
MSAQSAFWGIWTPRGRGLLKWRLRAPGSKALPLYPVFSSREKAEEFVKVAYAGGTESSDIGSDALFLDLLGNIRKIELEEIPQDYYVLSDRAGFVKWSGLLGNSEASQLFRP